nr:hypothetical protein [Tanacetum cinerariifolium]
PVPPSTGVNSCAAASGSQPRSILKSNRILPAKSVNKKKVEEHPRTFKSSAKTTNRVDSSISSKRTAKPVGKPKQAKPAGKPKRFKQVWKPKPVKQVWKPTGKIFTTV